MTQQRLELVLDDVIGGEPIRPSSMPVALLASFHKEVADFLKGSQTDVDLNMLRVGVESGSYKLVLSSAALVAGLVSDLALLRSGNLDDMDPKRAQVIESWQKNARRHPTRRYALLVNGESSIDIHAASHFMRQEQATWVRVEKYLLGEIVDLGGTKPNTHLQLSDGTRLTIQTRHDQVLEQSDNLVYRQAMLRVSAEQELHSGKLRNVHLIEFVRYQPRFDPDAFAAMVAKGRKAWADVPDASRWVEEQRGAA